MARFFQALIKVYSYIISPFLGQSCRYHPTCSCYAHQALGQHGVLKGLFLIICRILSCHPWSRKNAHDPVPERFAWGDVLRYKRPCCDRKAQSSTDKTKLRQE